MTGGQNTAMVDTKAPLDGAQTNPLHSFEVLLSSQQRQSFPMVKCRSGVFFSGQSMPQAINTRNIWTANEYVNFASVFSLPLVNLLAQPAFKPVFFGQ